MVALFFKSYQPITMGQIFCLDQTIHMHPIDPRVTMMTDLDKYEYVDMNIEAESNVILFFSNSASFQNSFVFHLGWKTDDDDYKSWTKTYDNADASIVYDKSEWFNVKNKFR